MTTADNIFNQLNAVLETAQKLKEKASIDSEPEFILTQSPLARDLVLAMRTLMDTLPPYRRSRKSTTGNGHTASA